MFKLAEFIALIDCAALVVSVNTSTIHIAAAMQTPVIVLYALTNPQHTPWKVTSDVFYFPVDKGLQSKNEIVKYVSRSIRFKAEGYPTARAVAQSARRLLNVYKAPALIL